MPKKIKRYNKLIMITNKIRYPAVYPYQQSFNHRYPIILFNRQLSNNHQLSHKLNFNSLNLLKPTISHKK
jgi:hypothetical protein